VHAFSAIGARITGFRTAMAARWAGQRATSGLLAHLIRDVHTRSTLATVFAPAEGLAQAACASGVERRSYDGTLKIYEADLNRRLDRLMS